MSLNSFMDKVRQLDYATARWLMRHFYFLFFQIILVILFFVYLYEAFRTLDQLSSTSSPTKLESFVGQQTLNNLVITALMILNSFWMLYIFNGLERIRNILKDISFNLLRRK